MATFRLTGAKQVIDKLKKLAQGFPDEAARALYVEAELVMTRSKREFVPVDLGNLRNSGFVEKPVRRGKEITIVMGYGGAAAAYALAVHETPSGYDPPSWQGVQVQFNPQGRGPKYLERPLLQEVPKMADRIAGRLKVERL